MNVKRLDGDLLNFWVAKSLGLKLLEQAPEPGTPHDPESGSWHPDNFHPASNWSHAGPIVANEWYVIEDTLLEWFGPEWPKGNMIINFPTAWFMRAYVASQYGDEVEEVAPVKPGGALSAVNLARLKLGSLRGRREVA